jgi:hypothetical protein
MNYLKSSPHFFRLIKRSCLAGIGVLFLLAVFFPAPLEQHADFGHVPNPSKSAWFLLWMQELVGYSSNLVLVIGGLALFYTLLPWLPGTSRVKQAQWLPSGQWTITWITLVTFAGIIILTTIALVFRGENWAFVWPF